MATSKIKQSETIVVKRSTINFAPYNPKKHSKEAIEQQKSNFKKVGFLGGIVLNLTTRNLVSGHKRVMALDLAYGYDGSEKTDYDLKVEAIELTEKQEKEQNIYMDARSSNTSQDLELLSLIIPEIDIKNTGLTDYDISVIETIVPDFAMGKNETFIEARNDLKKDYDERKQEIKDLKKNIKKQAIDRGYVSYFSVTFKTYDEKAEFLESIGINGDEVMLTGETFRRKLEE